MNCEYNRAKEIGCIISPNERWERGLSHHSMSIRIMKFIEHHDLYDNDDELDLNTGGDGDNGETLMFLMDSFFEYLDKEKGKKER